MDETDFSRLKNLRLFAGLSLQELETIASRSTVRKLPGVRCHNGALGGKLSMNRSLTALLLHSLFQGEDKPGHFPGTRFVEYIDIIIFRMTVDQHLFCQVVRMNNPEEIRTGSSM